MRFPTGAVAAAVLLFTLLFAAPALAQDSGEALQGVLRDAEGEPVSGVTLTVTRDGEEVGQDTTDEDGRWRVDLPAPGTYTVTLDTDTLPEDMSLRNPDGDVLEDVQVRTGQARTVLFPLGEGGVDSQRLARVAQLLLSGTKFGLIIAMSAIGLSLIYGTTGLVNFAHGELVTLGAVVAWVFNASGLLPNVHVVLAGLASVVLVAGFSGLLDRGLWQPLRERGTGLIQMLVISIGLSLLLRHLVLIAFGGRPLPFAQYALQQAIQLGPVRATPRDLGIMALSVVVLVGVGLVLQTTRTGKAMRAVADNRDLAESSGIDVQRVIRFVWVFGGGLAATGGILFGLSEKIFWDMGFFLLLLMFAGVILGGIGTAFGAMVGSLVVGIVSQLSTLWFPTELQVAWGLGILILVLLFRPQGILGHAERVG